MHKSSPFSLEGHSALVTGSSMGIGNAIGKAMTEAGASVVFHGLEPRDTLDSPPRHYLSCDLTAFGTPEKFIDDALALQPALSLLVCNAGSNFNAPFMDMSEERWDLTMNLNLKANYFVAQAFARKMAERQRSAAILFTGSVNGFQAELNSSAYDISKGGIVMMVRSVAMELADYDIRVNGIAPGLIYTDKTRPGIENTPGKRAHFERKILRRRIGNPEDCAGAAVFLLSSAASYITGEIIVIDGGLTVNQVGTVH